MICILKSLMKVFVKFVEKKQSLLVFLKDIKEYVAYLVDKNIQKQEQK